MPTPSQLKRHVFLRGSWKIILGVILLLPFSRWYMIAPLEDRISSVGSICVALGQVTALLGTLLFSFSLVVSYRNRFTEIFFGGLDRQYRIHHASGMYGMFLLFAHPLLLAVPLLIYSVASVADFFTPFKTSTGITLGIFSLLGFMLLISITLFGVMFSYQTLKRFHQFFGVAFLLGAVHGLTVGGDIRGDIFIKYWLFFWIIFGMGVYVAHTLFKKFIVKYIPYTVEHVTNIKEGITEVRMVPTHGNIHYLPGQFAFFSFPSSYGVTKESHPFTISSWGEGNSISFSAKALGDFTQAISGVKVGDHVLVEGSFGEFSYLYGKKDQVWVAGGIGVTPFVAMAKHIQTLSEFPYTIDFYYSARTQKDLAYHDVFTDVAKKFSSFRYHPMPSDAEGYVTGELLFQTTQNIQQKDFFICGPPIMMKTLTTSLVTYGVHKKAIHSELFSLLR